MGQEPRPCPFNFMTVKFIELPARYRSMKTGQVYELTWPTGLTYAEQEAKWRKAYNDGVNAHCYEFLDDWTPGMFDDENKS